MLHICGYGAVYIVKNDELTYIKPTNLFRRGRCPSLPLIRVVSDCKNPHMLSTCMKEYWNKPYFTYIDNTSFSQSNIVHDIMRGRPRHMQDMKGCE